MAVVRVSVQGAQDKAASQIVSLELDVSSVLVGRWEMQADEIDLPSDAESFRRRANDVLSRARVSVEDSKAGLERRVHRRFDRFVRRAVRMGPLRSLDMALDILHRLEQRKTREIETWQSTIEDVRPVRPENLRAVRDVYPRFVEQLADGFQDILGGFSDKVTHFEVRIDALARRLPTVALPLRVARELKSALTTNLRGHKILWIEFERPAGYLGVLPWEKWLARIAGIPVIRLSGHELDTFVAPASDHVLLGCSKPSRYAGPSPAAVLDMAAQIARTGPADRLRTVHLVADLAYGGKLQSMTPPPGVVYEGPKNGEDPASTWGQWIKGRLRGQAIDVLHLVAPGDLAGGSPVMTVAAHPAATEANGAVPLRFLEARDVAGLATRLGARAIVLTGFGNGASRAALRLMCDHVSKERPGLVASHDFGVDYWDGHERGSASPILVGLFRFIAGQTTAVPAHPSLAIYSHPARLAAPEASSQPRPRWVAATHRRIEQLLSQALAPTGPGTAAAAAREGVVDALKHALDALSRDATSDQERQAAS